VGQTFVWPRVRVVIWRCVHDGGLVADGGPWIADHCLGPFGIGAFVAETRAHRPSLWELSEAEGAAMGPSLSALSRAMVDALDAERVYLSMWVDIPPHHVHLVLEPRYRDSDEADGAKAWELQQWRRRQGPPNPPQAAAAAEEVRNAIADDEPRYDPRR
jgi:diadenosine tetraphosphate (Ap4A) HIT family hydrolase